MPTKAELEKTLSNSCRDANLWNEYGSDFFILGEYGDIIVNSHEKLATVIFNQSLRAKKLVLAMCKPSGLTPSEYYRVLNGLDQVREALWNALPQMWPTETAVNKILDITGGRTSTSTIRLFNQKHMDWRKDKRIGYIPEYGDPIRVIRSTNDAD